MQTLPPTNSSPKLHALFAHLDSHLAIASILAGLTPAPLYADDPEDPRLAITWFQHRLFLAGDADDPSLVEAARQVLNEIMLPEAQSAGRDAFVLHAWPDTWASHLDALFPGREAIHGVRQYFTCDRLQGDWRPMLPDGFEILPVDAALLETPGLGGLEALREEMLSERPSVEDFLAKSFGVCPVYKNEVVGWCLSEYNVNGRCEVGVATAEAHQRRGLGTVQTLALVEMALQRGYTQVGWHCWKRNLPSAALARRAGFQHSEDYTVYLYILAPEN